MPVEMYIRKRLPGRPCGVQVTQPQPSAPLLIRQISGRRVVFRLNGSRDARALDFRRG